MMLFFTSGTTGLPKMTEQTHAYALGHITTGKYWMDLCPDDVHWTMSDTGWAKCAYGLFGPWTQGACTFIYNAPFDAKAVLEVLQKYPVSTFCSPPTGYRMMVHEDIKACRFPKLRHCLSAGEPINPEVMDEWKQATGLEIREGYGQTETTLLCGTYRCIENRPGSMGKPMPGYDIKRLESGNDLSRPPTGYYSPD
ncbi:hypothetical protein QZH41_004907 [Actinostola sp. cb2023]|nr:hypothetical protein QZH41_004907 [Actinostola sp. cb2023]